MERTATINFKVDAKLKKQFEYFSDAIGISVSSLLNCFIKRALVEQKIPFEIGIDNDGEKRIKAAIAWEKLSGSGAIFAKQLGIENEQDVYDYCHKFRRGLIK